MANSTVADPEKMDTSNAGEEEDEENNVEDEEEEDGPDEEEEDLEPVETVVVGQTYKCRRSDNTLHAAEIVKTRKTKDNAEEYYVHYAGLTRRQNEWVDKTRVLQVKEAKEDEDEDEDEEEANGLPDGKGARGNKRKLEDGDTDHKKRKVDEEDSFVEELTCPLCKSLFKDPVILECGHNFCKLCIDKAWEGSGAVSCPECKESVADKKYTTNRVLANLVKKAAVSVKEVVKPKEKCDEHDERLKLFCKDDGILACVICRDSLKHSAHNFLPIQDAVGVYRDQLIALATPLETTMKENQKMKSEQSQKIAVHKDNIADYKRHIESEFSKLHTFLREKEAKMVEDLHVEGELLVKDMEQNLIKMTDNCQFIEEAISITQSRLNESDPIAFLTDIKNFIEKCCDEHRKGVPVDSVLVNRELSQGRFKGPIQYIIWKELKNIVKPGLAPLTLDPQTAHPNLVLTEGLTSVKYTDTKQQLPDNPKRFSKMVWVVGHSFIRQAEDRARVCKLTAGIGLKRTTVRWLWRVEMSWSDLIPMISNLLATEQVPDILLVHLGGNDLAQISKTELYHKITKYLKKLSGLVGMTKVAWSEIIPRMFWRGALSLLAVERARKKLNAEVARWSAANRVGHVRHGLINFNKPDFFGKDGVHLSEAGMDMFMWNIKDALEKWGCE